MAPETKPKGILYPPFNPSAYSLVQDDLDFFRKATGIDDEAELKDHLISATKKAYETAHPYPCIWCFHHIRLAIALHPSYPIALAQCQPSSPRFRADHVFLDVGVCFGVDIRKLVFDGWDGDRAFATELEQGLVASGYDLFRDSPTTCPVTFVVGDIFSDTFFDPSQAPPASLPPSSPASPPSDLSSLRGKVTALYAGKFFHLFDEPTQLKLAKRLAALLNLESSSTAEKPTILFGCNVASPEQEGIFGDKDFGAPHYAHSPSSWTRLWKEEVFGDRKDEVEVSVRMERCHKNLSDPMDFEAFRGLKLDVDACFMDWTVEVWRK